MISDLCKFSSAFLQLEKVVVASFNALIGFTVFTLFESAQVAEAINFKLVTSALFLKLVQLVCSRFVILADLIASVSLLLNVTLSCEDLSLTPRNLLTK